MRLEEYLEMVDLEAVNRETVDRVAVDWEGVAMGSWD